MAKKRSNKSSQSNQKKRFEVKAGETIDQCLERIKQAGYMPVRRTEEPIFQEVSHEGKVSYQPVDRKIVFDALISKPND